MKKYLLITAACAECRGWESDPLIEKKGPFDTLEEAKAATWMKDPVWLEHPDGGWFAMSGQGDDWIISIDDLIKEKE